MLTPTSKKSYAPFCACAAELYWLVTDKVRSTRCSAVEVDECTCVAKTGTLTKACDTKCKADHACTKTAPCIAGTLSSSGKCSGECAPAPANAFSSGSFLAPMLPFAAAFAVAAAVLEAAKCGSSSVSLPPISTGIYRFPIKEASKAIVRG